MAQKKLIYVACGSAAATSNLVKSRLDDLLKKESIPAIIEVCRVSELPNKVNSRKPNLVIVTAGSVISVSLPEDVPILPGLPLMTMVGVQSFIEQVKQKLLQE